MNHPVVWELDPDNPYSRPITIEGLRKTLSEEYNFDGSYLEWLIEYELIYRGLIDNSAGADVSRWSAP